MKSISLIIGAVLLILLVAGGIYLYPQPTPIQKEIDEQNYSEITYDDCVRDELNKLRKLRPAIEEETGAERLDGGGNVWIKQEDGSWKTNAERYENTDWGDALIDEQPGGANYIPDEFPECEKYIFTRNAKMEEGLREIIDEVIKEQSQKGITITAENIEVLNLVGRLQGNIDLVCETLNHETDEEIIKSIADKLFLKYPNEFAEGSERDSWVNVRGCSETGSSSDGINFDKHTTQWVISNGYYDFRI